MTKRWTVRKGGSATGGYTIGWFAMSHDGQQGEYLPTFQEAIKLATTMADAQHARALRGMQPVPAAKHAARPEWADVCAWSERSIEASEHTA